MFLFFIVFISLSSRSQQLPQSISRGKITEKKQFVPLAAGKKDWIAYKEIFKSGIRINHFQGESGFLSNTGFFSNDSMAADHLLQYTARNTLGIGIGGIPITAEYVFRKATPLLADMGPDHWYKISFDAEQYKEQWRKIAEKLSPESLSEAGKQYLDFGKAFKDRLVEQCANGVKGKMKQYLDSITRGINPAELAEKTPEELATLIFGKDLKGLKEGAKEKLKETEAFEMIKEKKDSVINEMKTRIEELEAKEKYLQELSTKLKEARATGLIDSMKTMLNKATEEYHKLLENPQELIRRLASKYNLGGLGKLITFLSQLKLGGQTVPFAEQAVTPFLSKGISFEINIKDKFIGFSTGRLLPMMNNIRFPGFDSLSNNPGNPAYQPSYWHLNYRKGKLTDAHKGIRLTSIQNMGSNNNPLQPADFIRKNTLLINLYSRERIFGDNWLSAEISKSISTSPNRLVTDSFRRSPEHKPSLFDWNNLSLKVKLEGVIESIGLIHQAYLNKTIGTYVNFTTVFPATSGYEAGFSARMKQKGKKLSSYLKGSFRNYVIPGFTDSRWKTADLRLRMTYKLKKGQQVQFGSHWRDGYKVYSLATEQRTVRQQSRGITAGASLVNKRIFGLFNTSYLSLGLQRDIFPLTGIPGKNKTSSNSVSLMLNQVFLYREHLLSMNVSYTNVSQEVSNLLYNTQLDADLGGTFKINKNLSAGLSVVYGYLKGAYSNAGVRTSFSGILFKRIELDINSDIRKNITLTNPLFSQFFTLNCGIRYTIKK